MTKAQKFLPFLIASPIEELMLGSLLVNPKDVIGSPPNPIMKMQLTRLWKEVLGAGDIGDFETFMNEASDLTYREAREKLLRTYGTPWRLHVRSAGDIEGAFHAQMCESAAEECGKGDVQACRVACEECGIVDLCPPRKAIKPIVIPTLRPVQKLRKAPVTMPIEEIHKYLEERGIKPGKPVKPKPKVKKALSRVVKKIPRSGVVRITEKDIRAGKIILEW